MAGAAKSFAGAGQSGSLLPAWLAFPCQAPVNPFTLNRFTVNQQTRSKHLQLNQRRRNTVAKPSLLLWKPIRLLRMLLSPMRSL
jgi:hypothetical protein